MKSIHDKNNSEHALKMDCGKKLEERLVIRISLEESLGVVNIFTKK